MYTNKYNFGEQTLVWNPWKGCFRVSEACENCYVKPINSFENKYYPLPFSGWPAGTVITVGLRTDFFLKEADDLRHLAWTEIRRNPHLIFLLITKRPERIKDCLPPDWGDGWDNVILDVTMENQQRAEERAPILLELPAKHKWIACTPLLEKVDLSRWLSTGEIEYVEALGEKGFCFPARPLHYDWLINLHEQCKKHSVRFDILYIGHNLIMPDGAVLRDSCPCYHSELADSLALHNYIPITFQLKTGEVVY